ncbi:unnamed protein product [Closterium sp. Yama58-4]|nr:unnamed protein product [Closterium sp. Yama58-4]
MAYSCSTSLFSQLQLRAPVAPLPIAIEFRTRTIKAGQANEVSNSDLAYRAIEEIRAVFDRFAHAAASVPAMAPRLSGDAAKGDPFETLVEEIVSAKDGKITLYGVGREGLMMRALAMRLYHLGLQATVVGDMSCPPIGPGDLLLVSAGPGRFSTVEALLGEARSAGARTAVITAQPEGDCARLADRVVEGEGVDAGEHGGGEERGRGQHEAVGRGQEWEGVDTGKHGGGEEGIEVNAGREGEGVDAGEHGGGNDGMSLGGDDDDMMRMLVGRIDWETVDRVASQGLGGSSAVMKHRAHRDAYHAARRDARRAALRAARRDARRAARASGGAGAVADAAAAAAASGGDAAADGADAVADADADADGAASAADPNTGHNAPDIPTTPLLMTAHGLVKEHELHGMVACADAAVPNNAPATATTPLLVPPRAPDATPLLMTAHGLVKEHELHGMVACAVHARLLYHLVGRDPQGRTARSDFEGPHGGTIQQYFQNQYGISLQYPDQPLFTACRFKPELQNAVLMLQAPPECECAAVHSASLPVSLYINTSPQC